MITLKTLKIKDFLSHEDTKIDFKDSEKILLDGSSGAGKSSIFDSIIWCLYGVGRAENRSLIRRGAEKCTVSVEFRDDGQEHGADAGYNSSTDANQEDLSSDSGGQDRDIIIITRAVTSGGKHILEVAFQKPDGTKTASPLMGIRELQNWIDKKLIGASYLLFINSVAYVQGNMDSFVAQPAPKRKELLLEIVKADDYEKYYESSKDSITAVQNEQSKIAGEVVGLKSNLDALKERIGSKETHISDIASNTLALAEIDPKIEELEKKKVMFEGVQEKISLLRSAWSNSFLEESQAQGIIDGKKKKILSKPSLIEAILRMPKLHEDIKAIQGALTGFRDTLTATSETESKRAEHYAKKPIVNDIKSEADRHNEQIEFLKKKELCPSGDQCPYYHKTSVAIKEHTDQIALLLAKSTDESVKLAAWALEEANLPPAANIRALVADISTKEREMKDLETELSRIEAIQKECDLITEIEAEVPGLEKELEEKKARTIEAKAKLDEAIVHVDESKQKEVVLELTNLRVIHKKHSENIIKSTSALEHIDKDEGEMQKLEERIRKIEHDDLGELQEKERKLNLVKEAFGSKGIETMVIDYLVPKLEDHVNKILSRLSDFTIRIDTQKATVDEGGKKEGLWITVINEAGQEMDYDNYSGGEKVRITVAIAEALAGLCRNVGFRMVDEAVMALSPEMTESFTEVFATLLEQYPQMLMISHLPEVKNLFDKSIEIKKTNGISFVNN